ncbi:MAG: alpha/beta fold hydrolase [Pseudobacteriovorax sp.]|nr:alpha/beta fold hydrolase [Pseudobacteriovorax sp.]
MVVSHLACTGVFYQPNSKVYYDITSGEVEYEAGVLTTSDQERLSYWNIAPETKEKGTILHFHGNAQNMTAHFLFVVWLIEAGYRVIVFDYRGYGASTGSPDQEGTIIDGTRMIEFACDKAKTPLFVVGQSLGGAIATPSLVKSKDSCICGLVLESTFDSYRDLARDLLGSFWLTWAFQIPLSWLISDEYAPYKYLKDISLPSLVVHGQKDPVVPIRFGHRVFDQLGSTKKEFILDEDGGHTSGFVPGSPIRDRLVQFLNKTGHQCR